MKAPVCRLKGYLSPSITMMLLLISIGSNSWSHESAKKSSEPSQLSAFEFQEPEYTDEEKADVEAAKAAEELEAQEFETLSKNELQNYWEDAGLGFFEQAFDATAEDGNNILVEIYQNAPSIGKQFLVVKQNQQIRYVFLVSAAAPGKSTPEGKNLPVQRQRWRHMSSLYPSAGKNNMDHVSYFNGPIGFHSTVFGLYKNLGKPDSHGCVRMGRPEARAVYTLIKANYSTTKINSYRAKRDPPLAEIMTIKALLKLDVNLVQQMLSAKNDGDTVPGSMSYATYLNARDQSILPKNQIEITPEQDFLNSNPGLAKTEGAENLN